MEDRKIVESYKQNIFLLKSGDIKQSTNGGKKEKEIKI